MMGDENRNTGMSVEAAAGENAEFVDFIPPSLMNAN
jgi:hypothetical protein